MPQGIMELFEGNDQLSEDFKSKVKTIFEAALSEKVSEIRAQLESENEVKLQEQAETAIADMEQKVDQFLTYVAEEWMDKNQVAIDKGIATEISESFLKNLHTLFEEHYVEVPDDKVDVVVEMAGTIEDLEDEKNTAVNENVALKQQVAEYKKAEIVAEMSDGLADSEKDKLNTLVSEMTFTDEDSFRDKINTIAETFLGKVLTEEKDDDNDDDDDDDDKKKKDKKKNPFVKESTDGAETHINESTDESVLSYAESMNRKSTY